MKIFAKRELWGDAISLHIGNESVDGSRIAIAQPLVFRQLDEGTVQDPCLRLKNNEAQMMMDELWHCGLRPSNGTGSAGSLAATEHHLKDMRSIAFHTLNINKA